VLSEVMKLFGEEVKFGFDVLELIVNLAVLLA
jgi:hypothetical protein